MVITNFIDAWIPQVVYYTLSEMSNFVETEFPYPSLCNKLYHQLLLCPQWFIPFSSSSKPTASDQSLSHTNFVSSSQHHFEYVSVHTPVSSASIPNYVHSPVSSDSILHFMHSHVSHVPDSSIHARTKHIEVNVHFVREKVLQIVLDIRYVPTESQLADVFTKALSIPRFQDLCGKLISTAARI